MREANASALDAQTKKNNGGLKGPMISNAERGANMHDVVKSSIASEIELRRDALLRELSKNARTHRLKARIDSTLHSGLIVVAAFGAFAAPASALIYPTTPPWLAGVIGGIPGLCVILISRLRCVRAANWHLRMGQKLDDLRLEIEYESPEKMDLQTLTSISKKWRELNEVMYALWEEVTMAEEKPFTQAEQGAGAPASKKRGEPA